MSQDLTTEKQPTHELIDRLSPAQLVAVAGLLKATLAPVSNAITGAPLDDAPETDEERLAVAEAKQWLRRHPGIPMEEILADFGLTVSDPEDSKDPT